MSNHCVRNRQQVQGSPGRERGAAETPDDAAFQLGARRNKLTNIIRAAVGDGRGKTVVAILGCHKVVAAIVLQLHGAIGAQDSHDADVEWDGRQPGIPPLR